jgi:hypothetical protein
LGFVAVDGVSGGFTEALPLEGDVFLTGDASHAGEHGHQDAAHVHEGRVVGGFLALEARQVEEVRYQVGEPFGLLLELRGEEACLYGVFVEGLFQAFGQQFQARRRRLKLVGDVRDEVPPDLVDPLEFVGADGMGAVSPLQRLLPVLW